MKKNISINISGIIFNIEEDGYERLKIYLDEIKRYFATYDGSEEIAADIETRIAEIFLAKLGPQKQVITSVDVENLIIQMGNVHDFEAIEEQDGPAYNSKTYQHTTSSAHNFNTEEANNTEDPFSDTSSAPKKFYRDGNRRVIAGVASGLGHYFRIDPIWVRILLIVLFLVDPFITFFTVSSAIIIAYIVAWIIVPERYDLSGDRKVKKIFRDPENKVIGGVAGGLGAYLGLDPVILRILFVVFIPTGSIIAYVILWIIIPQARTLTDRMQMQGEPLTISNIEENIKKKLNLNSTEGEAVVARAVLIPFRFLASLLESLGRAAGSFLLFLGNVIRTIVGMGFIAVGSIFLIALFIATSFASGFIPELYIEAFDLQIPAYLAQKTVPPLLLMASFFSLLIPGLMIILCGIAFIAKRWALPAAAGWLLFALWIVSIVSAGIMAPPYLMDFRVRNFHEEKVVFASNPEQTIVLSLKETDNLNYNDVFISIEPSTSKDIELVNRFNAKGKNHEEAANLARKSQYSVLQKGDSIFLSQHLFIPDKVHFRWQGLEGTLFIPTGQKFKIEPNLQKILYHKKQSNDFPNYRHRSGVYVFKESGELVCLDCN